MILYVNGDSNCCGVELNEISKSWPNLLAEKLSATLINHSVAGASNPRILRLTKDFLNTQTDVSNLLVIVATTTWEREEWIYKDNYYNVSAGTSLNKIHPDLHAAFTNWILEQNDVKRAYRSDNFHKQFFDLHVQLQQQKIKHVFFHAINPFEDGIEFKTFDKFDWSDSFIDPYNQQHCYYWYLKNAGYVPTKGFHHLESAQQHWADFIYQYLEKHRLL